MDNFEEIYTKISNKYQNNLNEIQNTLKKEKILQQEVFYKRTKILTLCLTIIIIVGLITIKLIGELLYGIIFFTIMFLTVTISYPTIYIFSFNFKNSSKLKNNIRNEVILDLLKEIKHDFKYYPSGGIPSTIYNKAGVEEYSIYSSAEFISCRISDKSALSMAQTKTQITKTKQYGDETIIPFAGIFAMINTPQPFNYKIYIKKDRHDKNNRLIKKDQYKFSNENMRVILDSNKFEDIFDIYASDKIIAYQILTADIMQMLENFYNSMEKDFEITIKDDYIYIRIWNDLTFGKAILTDGKIDKEILYKDYTIINFILNLSNELVNLLTEI